MNIRFFLMTINVFLLSSFCFADSEVAPNKIRQIDLLIEGDHLVTMENSTGIIEKGAVAIHQGVIVAVGKAENIKKLYLSLIHI